MQDGLLLNIFGDLNQDYNGDYNVVWYDFDKSEEIKELANFIFTHRDNDEIVNMVAHTEWLEQERQVHDDEITEHLFIINDDKSDKNKLYKVYPNPHVAGCYTADIIFISEKGNAIKRQPIYCPDVDLNTAKNLCVQDYIEALEKKILKNEKKREAGGKGRE